MTYYFSCWDDPVACFFVWMDDGRVINEHFVGTQKWTRHSGHPSFTVPLSVKMLAPVKPVKQTGTTKRKVSY